MLWFFAMSVLAMGSANAMVIIEGGGAKEIYFNWNQNTLGTDGWTFNNLYGVEGSVSYSPNGFEDGGMSFVGGGIALRDIGDYENVAGLFHPEAFISVDIRASIPSYPGTYLSFYIFGNQNWARFIFFPYEGYAKSVVDLGDGWYRYELASIEGPRPYGFPWGFETNPSAYIELSYNTFPGGTPQPLNTVIDNLRIFSVPEPSALSLLAFALGGLAILRRRRS
jgi:hypothetical protein